MKLVDHVSVSYDYWSCSANISLALAVIRAVTKWKFTTLLLADIPADVFAEVRVQLKLQWEAVLP